MFGGLLGGKFVSKCKSLLKVTRTRLETVRRKRSAVQKYLKNDIADLLRNGFDDNAYGRAEGLLVEMNMTSCYDMVEQFCGCISSHIAAIHKQRECPEECKEAVSSLMFAAARFADLPELRGLRNMFAQKYGNSLDSSMNQEFVEKLKQVHPTKDMKIQLMRDIAKECSVDWNSKALEQKLYTPPAAQRDLSLSRDYHEEFRKLEEDGYKQRSRGHAGHTNEEEYEDKREVDDNDDDAVAGVDPKPRSMRRRPLKPPPGFGNAGITSPSKTRTRKEDQGHKNLPMLNTEDDEQENENHYSSKQSTNSEPGKAKAHPRRKSDSLVPPPAKITSLPPEPSSSMAEEPRGHARAASLQSDTLGQASHVHPKLPDYEDLAARLAALRGI